MYVCMWRIASMSACIHACPVRPYLLLVSPTLTQHRRGWVTTEGNAPAFIVPGLKATFNQFIMQFNTAISMKDKVALQTVATAVDTFLMVLDSHTWTAMPSVAARSRSRSLPSSDAPNAASSAQPAGSPADPDRTQGGDPSTPPYTLMEHAPVAIFVNGLLTAFNELRHCAPLSLAAPLASILQVTKLAVLSCICLKLSIIALWVLSQTCSKDAVHAIDTPHYR